MKFQWLRSLDRYLKTAHQASSLPTKRNPCLLQAMRTSLSVQIGTKESRHLACSPYPRPHYRRGQQRQDEFKNAGAQMLHAARTRTSTRWCGLEHRARTGARQPASHPCKGACGLCCRHCYGRCRGAPIARRRPSPPVRRPRPSSAGRASRGRTRIFEGHRSHGHKPLGGPATSRKASPPSRRRRSAPLRTQPGDCGAD